MFLFSFKWFVTELISVDWLGILQNFMLLAYASTRMLFAHFAAQLFYTPTFRPIFKIKTQITFS